MTTRMLLGLSVCLCLASACRAGLLRVPKVYNAIISSSDNLSPSRAFPLIQPVLHETPLGYPLGPVVYHQPPAIQQPEASGYPDNTEDKETRQETTPKATEPPKSDISPPKKEEKARENPPRDPVATENPLKLNDLGLPPSLVPVQQYSPKVTYSYDPYNPYNPYYPDPYGGVIFPYGNPYSPYYQPAFSPNPFNPYVVQSPFYSIPQGGEPQGPQWGPEQPWGPPRAQPQPGPQQPEPRAERPALEQQPPKPADQPSDLNIKNNSNKNAAIPDVPPPPLPVGGLKYATDKKSS